MITATSLSVTPDHSVNVELLPPLHHRDTGTDGFTVREPSVNSDGLWNHEEVQSTRYGFLIVRAVVMQTSVFPALQCNTVIPERARLECSLAFIYVDQSAASSAYSFPNDLPRVFLI